MALHEDFNSNCQLAHTRRSVAVLLLSAVACVLLANKLRVKTGTYSFHNVADTREHFEQFYPSPAVDNAGTIVFSARLKTGVEGIFAAKSTWAWGATPVTLADTRGDLGYLGSLPSLNEAGTVLFSAGYKRGSTCDATVPVKGGPITTVAVTSGPSKMTTFGMSSINRAGQVVFFRMQDNGRRDLCVGDAHGGPLTSVADNQGQFYTFGLQPSITDAGSVVFLANNVRGGWSLCRIQRPGDAPILLLAEGTKGLIGLTNPVTNAQGTVVFHGSWRNRSDGIFKLTDPDKTLTMVAEKAEAATRVSLVGRSTTRDKWSLAPPPERITTASTSDPIRSKTVSSPPGIRSLVPKSKACS